MNKKKIIEFFNRLSKSWDEGMIRNEEVISLILDNANIKKGSEVLDVACGTGVLFNDYLNRDVKSITAIDISSEMVKIAKEKFKDERIDIILGDGEEYDFEKKFDAIVIYNAFPHFTDPDRLIKRLSSFLKPGGRLTIAHGMSRDDINACHRNTGDDISNTLPEIDELKKLVNKYLDVIICISDDKMYQIVAINK